MPTKIEKLANNSTMYYRGDTCIEISPFTSYYIFTIYKESNDEQVDDHIPLNLTNLGTVWLSFINGDTKIRVANYTNVDNIDMTNGEVVFRISEDEATRILAIGNNTFYISTAISDGNTSSDETVLFSGYWSDYSLTMKSSLTETIETLNDNIKTLKEKISTDSDAWTLKLNDAQTKIDNLQSDNDTLTAKIIELEAKIAEYDSSYVSATIVTTSSDSDNYLPNSASKIDISNIELKAQSMKKISLNSTFKYK